MTSIRSALGMVLVMGVGFSCGQGLHVEANGIGDGVAGDGAAIGGEFWEDFDRTYVGALVGDPFGVGVDEPYCSGTMISETVFLTAAHCIGYGEGGVESVGFAQDMRPGEAYDVFEGTAYVHPDYAPPHYHGDVAVIVLDEAPGVGAMPLADPGLLPAKNRVSGTSALVTGYGAEPPGVPNGTRRTGTRTLKNAGKQYITANEGAGDAMDCYGDSGGPLTLSDGEQDAIVGVVSWGDVACASMSKFQRVDIPSVRAFLADFVDL